MKYVVVDTDVFSRLYRGQDVDQYRQLLADSVPVLSFASVAELHFGAVSANWGDRRRQGLEDAISRYVIPPYNEEMAKLWGQLKAQAVRAGHPLGAAEQTNDLWVCATAIYHNAPLLTGNLRHFENFPGLTLLS